MNHNTVAVVSSLQHNVCRSLQFIYLDEHILRLSDAKKLMLCICVLIVFLLNCVCVKWMYILTNIDQTA